MQLMNVLVALNKFKSKIKHNGQSIHLGMYDTEEEAHAAYLAACRKYRGDALYENS